MLHIAGMPLIELVARRASRSGFEVVVATSQERYDDRIAQHLASVGIEVFRGPLDDVLERFRLATADLAADDRVIRLTGDNPFVDADLLHELIAELAKTAYDYGRVDIEQVPEGLGVEVFSAASLRRAAASTDLPYDREHVTPWIRRECGELLFAPARNPGQPHLYRCTVDCLDDYVRASQLFDGIADPVGVSWEILVAELVARVDAGGAAVAQTQIAGQQTSQAVLGVGSLLAGRDLETAREVFIQGVHRGINRVWLSPEQASFVASATLPGLRRRLDPILVLPSGQTAAGIRSVIETAFAQLGERRAAALVVAAADLADAGVAAELASYREAGISAATGVVAAAADDVSQLSGQVELVAWRAQSEAELAAIPAVSAASGLMPAEPGALPATALNAADVDFRVIEPANAEQLREQLDQLAS